MISGGDQMSRGGKTIVGILVGGLGVCTIALLALNIALNPVRATEPSSSSTSEPEATAGAPASKITAADLSVEEYPIVAQEVDSPEHLEYLQRISAATLSKRQAWREPSAERVVESANKALEEFGYRLEPVASEPVPTYQLYRDHTVIRKGITRFWPVTVNERRDDFVLLIEINHRDMEMVQRGKVEAWNPGPEVRTPPVYYGNDLVSTRQEGLETIRLERGDEVLYTVQVEPQVDNPVKGLWGWDGHWVLEVDGQLIIDGQSLNEELGYNEVFGWALLGGKPFYFFSQGGQVRLSYAGETLPYTYDDVVHYQCCEPAAFNPRYNEDMVWFHALRDGTWHYVEAGAYR
jgi:hypothetical protein